MSFRVTRDTLTPGLAAKARACGNPRRILEAMGLALVSVTQRAFNDESLRASPWPPVKHGGAPLKKSGALWHSVRIAETTSRHVKVGTDRPYAPYHQYGVKPFEIRPSLKKALYWPGAAHPVKPFRHPGLPPRPFFPFVASGRMTRLALPRVRQAAQRALDALLARS